MTTATPTSDQVLQAVEVLATGLPDEATLTRLANELFRMLPGDAGSPSPTLPTDAPAPSVDVPVTGFAAPRLAPASVSPTGVPDTLATSAPASDGHIGGRALGVPEAYAAALPQVDAAPTPVPSSPYYFVGESSAYHTPVPQGLLPNAPEAPSEVPFTGSTTPRLAPASVTPTGVPDTLATSAPTSDGRVGGGALGVPEAYAAALPQVDAAPALVPSSPYYFVGESSAYHMPVPQVAAPDDRVTTQPFNLPGAGDLRALLAEIDLGYARDPRASAPTNAPSTDSRFYFVDRAGAATGSVPVVPQGAHPPFDVHAIRRDFPILSERVHGRQLVWFDNAATTQKPQAVIDRLAYFYAHENSNIHRAAHDLAARATDAYEGARAKIARFLGASSAEEIVFVRGATEGVNLVAQTFGKQFIGEGDEIVVSLLEHHANIVPWQQIAAEKGAKLRVIPVDDTGQIRLDEYRKLLNSRTKLVAITQVSNALGTVTPVQEIVALAHSVGARALVDGAQSVSHMRVNVQALDADFFVFSGHKIFGPTGIGAVYGKKDLLNSLPPWQGGGNMIADVTFDRTLYHQAPTRFEAGTGNIADAVGLGAALDYLERVGLENVATYEHNLLAYATLGMQTVPGLRLIGTAREKASVLSFVLAGYTTEQVGKALNEEGIAVRSGHHCAQPILRRFGLEATVRPSLAFYNTCEEVDHMVAVLRSLARTQR
jgi:cysteine desulfurase/selenocysteine lyase